MRRVLAVAALVAVAAGAAGLLLADDEEADLRRVGLPALDDTVATVLDDATPVFVHRDADDRVQVVDARPPPRTAPEGTAALPDLLDGLVAWCDGRGFVDDLDPPATFTLDGAPTGSTERGLGEFEIAERHRAHVMVAGAEPGPVGAAQAGIEPEALLADCADPERTDDHAQTMHEAELGSVPAGSAWVVEAAVDLGAGRLCEPPDDPLAWPLCGGGGVAAELPERRPDPALADAHGDAYGERAAFGFVGRLLVARAEEGGPLERVWRLPYSVEPRAEPLEQEVAARLALADEDADTVTGEPPLATLAVDPSGAAGDDVPGRLPVEPATEVVTGDGEPQAGEEAVAALEAALDDEPRARWSLEIRGDPLRPPRLERLERLDGEAGVDT